MSIQTTSYITREQAEYDYISKELSKIEDVLKVKVKTLTNK